MCISVRNYYTRILSLNEIQGIPYLICTVEETKYLERTRKKERTGMSGI